MTSTTPTGELPPGFDVQNLSGSASFIRAQEHPEIAGLSGLFTIPAKLQFTISWNYLSEAAQGITNDADSAVALVPGPGAPPTPVSKTSSVDVNEPKWEMVIPRMTRPAAKPAAPPRDRPQPGMAGPPAPAETPSRRLAPAPIPPEPQFAPTFGMFARSSQSTLKKLAGLRHRITLPGLAELAEPLPDLPRLWTLAERYRIAILTVFIAAVFGVIVALWAGGPFR